MDSNAYKCIITERVHRRPLNICSMYNMAFLTYSGWLLWPWAGAKVIHFISIVVCVADFESARCSGPTHCWWEGFLQRLFHHTEVWMGLLMVALAGERVNGLSA